ncbi:putative metalloprotease CJM1_0395 family protein [Colwellia psychrerythraea]|uniref:SprA-related family n=1 Tax=Colwellia psychrerythraea TaxID=28229 RepID=A0A099KR38_COLPS|nr:putative metalloprotease CJM1_0395 family protein [Colwellia psychrerythraea]KGJ92655.1 SprA-related family [Colwellia psychrerythraea]
MNITPHTASLPLATVVNPPTEGLRRENHQREIITQVTATHPSVAEKGVASDKDRARTPAQTNEEVDFATLRKQAELAASSISEQESSKDDQQGHSQQKQEDQATNASSNSSENDKGDESTQQVSTNEKIITQLQQRDKEVRAHELAHATAGGAATGSPSYTFEIGPDGKKYATDGEVAVDLSVVAGDPQATIIKMQKIHAAAMAPTNPSAQDTRVAASAAQNILTAQSELLALKDNAVEQSSFADKSLNKKTNVTSAYENHHDKINEFDALINQTLTAQEAVISDSSDQKLASNLSIKSVQTNEVLQRAQRIESYYFSVSQGYEKPDNFQFKITA